MCHLSQPAFSALIRSVEQTVGLKLFDRSTRHVVLTREGERFLQSAERLAAEFAACERAMRDTAQLAQGHVSVALLPSLAAGWLPEVLKVYTARHPGVQLGVLDVLSEPCIAAVANGDADFALAAIRVDTPDLKAEPFCSDGFYMVCPGDHPLADKVELSLEDLTPWPFIHLARHSSVRQYLDAAFFLERCRLSLKLSNYHRDGTRTSRTWHHRSSRPEPVSLRQAWTGSATPAAAGYGPADLYGPQARAQPFTGS